MPLKEDEDGLMYFDADEPGCLFWVPALGFTLAIVIAYYLSHC
jgi:hypothetical protein